jgi:ATP-binding cassette subfamily B protein
LDHGHLVEQGNHAALIAKGGLYASLAALQFNNA